MKSGMELDTQNIITIHDLAKVFRVTKRGKGFFGALRSMVQNESTEVVAVKDINLTIRRGEVIGLIGPNGAGKSTTIKMLTGILTPTSGDVHVNGLQPQRNRRANALQIGVVFGQRTQLWWDLPLRDSFELLRHMYKIPNAVYYTNLNNFRELLGLDSFLDTPVRQLSLGQRMRGDLAAAMLHNPPILFLDEPTIGLDVVAKEKLREFIRTLNREQGVTVLLTTHDISDIEQLCRRLIIIDKGTLIYDGSLDSIRQHYGTTRTLVIDLEPDYTGGEIRIPAGLPVRVDGHRQWISFPRNTISAATLISQIAERYPIRDLSIEEPEIESIIRQIYEQGVPQGGAA